MSFLNPNSIRSPQSTLPNAPIVPVIKVFKHESGSTTCVEAVDPSWLDPGKNILVWVVMDNPTPEEARLLSDVFHIHELSIEDALNEIHHFWSVVGIMVALSVSMIAYFRSRGWI